MPPPPDEFPFSWEETGGPDFRAAVPAMPFEPAAASSQEDTALTTAVVDTEKQQTEKPGQEGGKEGDSSSDLDIPSAAAAPALAGKAAVENPSSPQGAPPQITEKVLKPILPPLRPDGPENIRMITVILRPRQDKTRDKLMLRRLFGLMICQPGDDRFAFHIFEHGKGHLLEFPNLTTGICPELVARISELVGAENVRIEPITFQ